MTSPTHPPRKGAEMNKAVSYNERAAIKYGWYDEIPLGARVDYPGLDLDPVEGSSTSKTNFALAVLDYQSNSGVLGKDGMLGPSTWAHMEETYGDETFPVDWDINSAVKYNQRSAQSLGWYGNLPQAMKDEYLGLKNDPVTGSQTDKEIFALAVHAFQENQSFGPGDLDGKLGPNTWKEIQEVYESTDPNDRLYVYENRRLKADGGDDTLYTIPFDDPDGLDLHKWGHFNSRNGAKPRLLVIHWGGIDPNHLFRVFSTPDRKVSSHGGVGQEDFYQFLDLKHSAWHAGYVNKYSIGIDICQQPTTQWHDYYRSRGYDVRKVANPARRPDGSVVGNRTVLSLDPQIAEATRRTVFDLCQLFDIPLRAPRGDDGLKDEGKVWHGVFRRTQLEDRQFQGVVGHHHISSQKWDMACWWGSIFDGTVLGD